MKIAINTLPLSSRHRTRGIGFYTKNLLGGLKSQPGLEVQEFSNINEVKNVDVIHYPFFDLFQKTLPLMQKFPTVVTIHDVTPLIFPQHYPPGIKGSLNNFYQRLALKNVKAILTDSLSSKKDIESFLKIDPKKVFSVPLALGNQLKAVEDKNRFKEVTSKYSLPKEFALYIGSVNWNKNLNNLTQACVSSGVDLVLVGKDFESKENLGHPEKQSYKQFLKNFEGHPKVHILGFVPDNDLAVLMEFSFALLLPSFYEGFGLPILEAQAAGTPVITSISSSTPEVAGEGALFVDPYKIEEIANAVTQIKNDDILRKKLIRKGLENVKKFSWEKTVAQTLKVYQYASSK